MRVAIVGAGVAGTLLAWWTLRARPAALIDIHTGSAGNPVGAFAGPGPDATAASGGLVRGFEVAAAGCAAAAESLAEIRRSSVLREQTGYREVGSVYVLAPFAELADRLAQVDRMLPGSASLLDADQLSRAYPFRGLPAATVGVAESQAGYVSPARWRAALLAELAGQASIRSVPVWSVRPDPAVLLVDGSRLSYDAVVVAAGAWTPSLLNRSGLTTPGLRVRSIQYGIYRVGWPGLGAFVDDTSGLYGRATEDGGFLLGLPTGQPDLDPHADPGSPPADLVLAERVAACAGQRLGSSTAIPAAERVVSATDCFHDEPGLLLRGGPGVFTFTAGSGGAAKTALAQSRHAADVLVAAAG